MHQDGESLSMEKLHVAATRPALVLGVPMELAVAIFFGSFAIANQIHSVLWGVSLLVSLWAPAALVVRRDYNGARIFFIWGRTAMLSRDAWYWGGASVAPLPVSTGYSRGIP